MSVYLPNRLEHLLLFLFMIKRFLYFLLFVFAFHFNSYSQNNSREWEQLLYQLGEFEDFESVSWESSYEMLSDLAANPLNINTATREELEQLPFLTAKDVENISEYIYMNGEMKTLGELVLVKDLEYLKRQLLFYFTYAGSVEKSSFPQIKNVLKYGKNTFVGTVKIPFYSCKGDKKGFAGYKYKHNLRYDFTYGDYVRAGFIGAQDAGEPFFAGKNSTGYDFYSYYFLLKKLGRIKTLAIGKYRVRFGMGLVINNNYGFGKLSTLSSMGRGSSNIRVHSSCSEGNYLQGAASTVNIVKGLDVSLFASYRKFDATLNKDGKTIATILESNYHRTETEIAKKNNSSHIVFGGNIDYRSNGFYVGGTAVYTSLDKELLPKTDAVYRRHYAKGKNFYNVGLNYGYTGHRISVSGETATGDCNALATINSVSFELTENVTLLALQRFYSYKYYSLFSGSFSDGGRVSNESGFYLGMTWRPRLNWNIMAYTDYAYFAWPKYQASGSSQSFDNLLQVSYAPEKWAFTARYRLRIREKDNEKKTSLTNQVEHRGRFSASYNARFLTAKTQADIAFYDYKTKSFGWMITQNLSYNHKDLLSINANFAYFNTDDYNSRVYAYERGLRHSYFFPAYYGKGIRYSLLAEVLFLKNLTITAKVGTTKYFDRDQIGSGYRLINHSSATDMEMQARWRF